MALTAIDWTSLLKDEMRLSFDILFGLAIGVAVIRSGLADKLMKRLLPYLSKAGVGHILGMALTVSLGSAKTGAALLASALYEGRISERTAKWGTLMLSFPAYLHRWPSTLLLAISLAKIPGAIFAAILLLRPAARFLLLIFIYKNGEHDELPAAGLGAPVAAARSFKLGKKLLQTLPLAWIFYAAAFTFVPWAESLLEGLLLGGGFFPVAGLAVAAASIANMSSALALADGSVAAHELTNSEAVFALLVGNGLGILTRLIRTNAGYYFGLFPGGLANKMLWLNFGTMAPFSILTMLLAAIPLFF
jgi:hypothetical protein